MAVNREKGFPVWDRELEREFFTEEEIAESDARVAVISALVEARNEKGKFPHFSLSRPVKKAL